MNEQDYYLILYDVSDDRRRNRLFKLLESYGAGYQYSVFEARLDAKQVVRLRHGIEDVIDREEDRVAILRLCETCRENAELMGCQNTIICQNVIVV